MLVAQTLKLSRGLLEKSSELWLWHTHEKSTGLHERVLNDSCGICKKISRGLHEKSSE